MQKSTCPLVPFTQSSLSGKTMMLHVKREFSLGWRGVGTVRCVSSIRSAGDGLSLDDTDLSVTGHPGVLPW